MPYKPEERDDNAIYHKISDKLTNPPNSAFKNATWLQTPEVTKVEALIGGWRNLFYFEFVNRFLEYPYGKEDPFYSSLPINDELDRSGEATGKNNIFKKLEPDAWIKNCKYIKGTDHNDWADLYLFKRTDGFTMDGEDTDIFDQKDT